MTLAYEIAMIACQMAQINAQAGGTGGPVEQLNEATKLLGKAQRIVMDGRIREPEKLTTPSE